MSAVQLTESEIRAHDTFEALMWALSRPGRPRTLPKTARPGVLGGMGLIGEALLDLETCFWTPDPELAQDLARSGARQLSPDLAGYVFLPVVDEAGLAVVSAASVGTMAAPDEAATLVLGCLLGAGVTLRLHGPGVDGQAYVALSGIPQRFWSLRRQRRRYPLGWDILLVDCRRVVGLPRSTEIEVMGDEAEVDEGRQWLM